MNLTKTVASLWEPSYYIHDCMIGGGHYWNDWPGEESNIIDPCRALDYLFTQRSLARREVNKESEDQFYSDENAPDSMEGVIEHCFPGDVVIRLIPHPTYMASFGPAWQEPRRQYQVRDAQLLVRTSSRKIPREIRHIVNEVGGIITYERTKHPLSHNLDSFVPRHHRMDLNRID